MNPKTSLMLTPDMVQLIHDFTAGAVATVDPDGAPRVSPKGTFMVVSETQLAFGDIRSPNTVANLRARPEVEVMFLDGLTRRGLRVRGAAEILTTDSHLRPQFEAEWASAIDSMNHFVLITITDAHIVTSPAYNWGLTAPELHSQYLTRMNTRTALRRSIVDPAAVTNELGQTIGRPLGPFTPPEPPSRDPMSGRYCTVETLDVSRHGGELFEAYRAATDDGDWTYLPYGPFPEEGPFLDWLATMENGSDPMFFGIIGGDGRCAGVASYLRIDPNSGSIEVGHIHLARSLQRTPAATEAMYLMMKRAFDSGFRRYEWKCDNLNAPSLAAARRLGFTYEGTFRNATHYKGRNRDTAWFAITEAEWPALEAEFTRWIDPTNFDDDGGQVSPLRTQPVSI